MPFQGLACVCLVTGSLTVAAWVATPVSAQKGKNPTSTTATGTLRCPGLDCPKEELIPDGIQADGPMPYGTADGAKIDRVGEFLISFVANGRFLLLDFSNGSVSCGTSCRRTFQTLEVGYDQGALFHTNVIDPQTGSEATNGLFSIPVGATWPSRVKIAFNTFRADGEEIRWAVRFNPRDYAPSDHVSVLRTSASSWEVFATADERAMLVSTCCGQRGNTNEGLYAMPFRLRITTP